jgi:hypothetical protein
LRRSATVRSAPPGGGCGLGYNPPSGELELRQEDVRRLEGRLASLEGELRRVEQHNLNLIKDAVVLKKQLAERPKRRGCQGDAGEIP